MGYESVGLFLRFYYSDRFNGMYFFKLDFVSEIIVDIWRKRFFFFFWYNVLYVYDVQNYYNYFVFMGEFYFELKKIQKSIKLYKF